MYLIVILCILALLIALQGYRVAVYRSKFVIKTAEKAAKSEDTVDLILSAWKELERVPYHQMVWKFWIPLDKFVGHCYSRQK